MKHSFTLPRAAVKSMAILCVLVLSLTSWASSPFGYSPDTYHLSQTTVTVQPNVPLPSIPAGLSILPGTISFQGVELWKPSPAFSACAATPFIQVNFANSQKWYIDVEVLSGFNFTSKLFTGGYSAGIAYSANGVKFGAGFATLYATSGTPGYGAYISASIPTK